MNRLGDLLKARLKIGGANFTEGMATAFLLFCIFCGSAGWPPQAVSPDVSS